MLVFAKFHTFGGLKLPFIAILGSKGALEMKTELSYPFKLKRIVCMYVCARACVCMFICIGAYIL